MKQFQTLQEIKGYLTIRLQLVKTNVEYNKTTGANPDVVLWAGAYGEMLLIESMLDQLMEVE